MYTILVDDSNALITTIKERIIQRSKLVDNLHFLMNPTYKTFDMTKFTAVMEYVTPVSRELHTEFLTQSPDLYKGMIEYKLPIDTTITREAGTFELALTFTYVEMDAEGNTYQHVRKTTPTGITIVAAPAWCDVIPDSALSALDQRIIGLEALVHALDDESQILYQTKADNIKYDEAGKYIQLTANSIPIGDRIMLNIPECNGGKCVKYIKIDTDGSMIVTYSDNSVENIGKVAGDVATGIYIPDVSKDGILTMTLSQDVGEPSYSWDINPSNDWNQIVDVNEDSDYVWEQL